jgi:hypothetical protein
MYYDFLDRLRAHFQDSVSLLQDLPAAAKLPAARPRNQAADYTGRSAFTAMFLQNFGALRAVDPRLWLYSRANFPNPAMLRIGSASSNRKNRPG